MTQYYINDKEVHDALESTKQKITNQALLELLKSRGVIMSSRTERIDLVKALSEFDFMYHEIELLASKIEASPRRARYKTTEIHNVQDADEEEIRLILEGIKDIKKPENNERFKISKENNTYKLSVDYTETDLSKTTLKQKQQNSAEIFIEKVGSTLIIQSPIKERPKEITESLKERFTKKFENSKPFEISLQDITDAKIRTDFFINILSSTESLTYHTVKSVGVESRIYMPGQDEEVSTYSTSEEDADDSSEIASGELQELVKASLSGTKILTTTEYKNLIANGFLSATLFGSAQTPRESIVLGLVLSIPQKPLVSTMTYCRCTSELVHLNSKKHVRRLPTLKGGKYLRRFNTQPMLHTRKSERHFQNEENKQAVFILRGIEF